jgi:hypothetical protein
VWLPSLDGPLPSALIPNLARRLPLPRRHVDTADATDAKLAPVSFGQAHVVAEFLRFPHTGRLHYLGHEVVKLGAAKPWRAKGDNLRHTGRVCVCVVVGQNSQVFAASVVIGREHVKLAAVAMAEQLVQVAAADGLESALPLFLGFGTLAA